MNRQKGFIPACAGNTVISSRASMTAKVHPRMRGEYSIGPLAS